MKLIHALLLSWKLSCMKLKIRIGIIFFALRVWSDFDILTMLFGHISAADSLGTLWHIWANSSLLPEAAPHWGFYRSVLSSLTAQIKCSKEENGRNFDLDRFLFVACLRLWWHKGTIASIVPNLATVTWGYRHRKFITRYWSIDWKDRDSKFSLESAARSITPEQRLATMREGMCISKKKGTGTVKHRIMNGVPDLFQTSFWLFDLYAMFLRAGLPTGYFSVFF